MYDPDTLEFSLLRVFYECKQCLVSSFHGHAVQVQLIGNRELAPF